MGPSALDRSTSATHSSVRSHRIVGLQPSVPRRHHWPTGGFVLKASHALRGQCDRIPSHGVAGRRIWLVWEAPDHSSRARQIPRGGPLSRASAPRPRAAAFFTETARDAAKSVRAVPGAWTRLLPAQCRSASQPEDGLALVVTLAVCIFTTACLEHNRRHREESRRSRSA